MNDQFIIDAVVKRLEQDPQFKFRREGFYLRHGICPQCGQPEVFISAKSPWVVKCGRENNCQYSESVRKIYPEIFNRMAEFVKENPEEIATAYMLYNRGFDANIIKGMYSKGTKKFPCGYAADTVRVELWGGHYWERLIDDGDIERYNAGRKAMFSYGSAGEISRRAWMPPGMTIEKNDTVIITEGIFKSLAWHHVKDAKGKPYKSITGMSASNLPLDTIKEHAGKNILWILALDNDAAGHNSSAKFVREMTAMGERCKIAFPRKKGEDWDDLYRIGKLNTKMLEESLWRGCVDMAARPFVKAAYLYEKERQNYFLFEFNSELYRCEVKYDHELNMKFQIPSYLGDTSVEKFSDLVKEIIKISNCDPEFLYFERDPFDDTNEYFFNIHSPGGTKTISVSGGVLASSDTFNKTLLELTNGRDFEGKKADLKLLRDKWFPSGRQTEVRTLPFLGYDAASGAYVFYDWAIYKGAMMKKHEHDYFTAGKTLVKVKTPRGEDKKDTKLYAKPGAFNPAWIEDYKLAFDKNGLITLAWWTGSFFACQIRDVYKSYPFLELSGEPGSGKSQLIEFLWRLSGRGKYEGMDAAKSTLAGRSRMFEQFSNLPVVLMESDREIGNKRGAWDLNEIKPMYDGRYARVVGKMTKGNDVREAPFRGTVLIEQNATVDADEAVLQRIVHMHCTQSHFSKPGKLASTRLYNMRIEDLAGYIAYCIMHEDDVLLDFKSYFAYYTEEFTKNEDLDNRIASNHAMVAALVKILGERIFGVKYWPKAWTDELIEYLKLRAADRHMRCMSDHPLLVQFWEQYEYLQEREFMPGAGFANLLNHSRSPETEIAINMAHFQEKSREYGLEPLNITDLKRLFENCRTHKYIGNRVVKSAVQTRNNASIRCFVFSVKP